MLKLIKLEFRKMRWRGNIRAFSICNVVIIGILCMMFFVGDPEEKNIFTDFNMVFAIMDAMIKSTFIVFGASLLAKLVIDEYKSRTITVLFTYPISRKKILVSKFIIVGAMTFSMIILSETFITALLWVTNNTLHYVPGEITSQLLVSHAINVLISAMAAAGMALIPLFFGMRKKSVPATILSAVIMVSLGGSSSDKGFSLSMILPIPITLGVIGCIIAYLSIRNIEKVDVA